MRIRVIDKATREHYHITKPENLWLLVDILTRKNREAELSIWSPKPTEALTDD